MSGAGFLLVAEVAERYRTSVRSIHGRTRLDRMPHLRRVGFRHLLFKVADLDAWDAGAPLEAIDLPDGSHLVRPVPNGRAGPD